MNDYSAITDHESKVVKTGLASFGFALLGVIAIIMKSTSFFVGTVAGSLLPNAFLAFLSWRMPPSVTINC